MAGTEAAPTSAPGTAAPAGPSEVPNGKPAAGSNGAGRSAFEAAANGVPREAQAGPGPPSTAGAEGKEDEQKRRLFPSIFRRSRPGSAEASLELPPSAGLASPSNAPIVGGIPLVAGPLPGEAAVEQPPAAAAAGGGSPTRATASAPASTLPSPDLDMVSLGTESGPGSGSEADGRPAGHTRQRSWLGWSRPPRPRSAANSIANSGDLDALQDLSGLPHAVDVSGLEVEAGPVLPSGLRGIGNVGECVGEEGRGGGGQGGERERKGARLLYCIDACSTLFSGSNTRFLPTFREFVLHECGGTVSAAHPEPPPAPRS